MADNIVASLRESAEWIKEMEHESWLGTAELQIEAADAIQQRDTEIERLRAERDGHKARLAIEAVTAPDADYDTMMDSLQARLRDLHAEIERLCAERDAEMRLADQSASLLGEAADEIVRLRAEVERLRAAGDALADALERRLNRHQHDAIDAWQEARRG